MVAALGFGGFFSLLAVGADTSPAWAIVAARGTSVPLGLIALVVAGTSLAMARRTLVFVVALGLPGRHAPTCCSRRAASAAR